MKTPAINMTNRTKIIRMIFIIYLQLTLRVTCAGLPTSGMKIVRFTA